MARRPTMSAGPHRRDLLRMAAAAGSVAALELTVTSSASAVTPITADLCVYGATMAGIAAAVQMRRMGGSVVIIEPTAHIGGMTTSGLSQTDIGTGGAVGGFAREFYRRVYVAYNGGPLGATTPMQTTFEPRVAAAVMTDLLTGAQVPVYTRRTLASVGRNGSRLTSVVAGDGTVVRAQMFIDASYEGDLLALAGVRYVIGRESNAVYGESNNGVQLLAKNQFTAAVDPYRRAGDPTSGLLPEISTAALAATGSGDAHVQAYCYRLCLTKAPNRIAFPRPAGYDPSRYALVPRLIAAGYADPFTDKAAAFMNNTALRNGKFDANSAGPFSFDHVGAADGYPRASWSQRAQIVADHTSYQQGLLYFLANDSAVRSDVRSAVAAFGLAPDEFTATGNWPPQLYVREARRMVSSRYVLTEADCRGQTTLADGVGFASYSRDSHNCQRLVAGGQVKNEGDIQIALPAPFRLPYRAMVPDSAQCTNLIVPVCLSASHVAYSSLRMEPVFMILGQAAGAAAKLALDGGANAQGVDPAALRARLFEDMAVLDYPDVAVDDTDPMTAVTGSWTASSAIAGYYGTGYLHDNNAGKGGKSVRFVPSLRAAGTYRVYLRWTSTAARASNVPVTIAYRGGSATLTVDQRAGGGRWALLGAWPFDAGTAGSVTMATTGTDNYVVADAARFVRAG
ncbi:FAD-dependent oxidoreductase [Frankia sp. CiP3]|uniref:FAD-dependent oxidoreductase n=1 Tax=Frankia sp. CiP3 TaxID=2880971 RepID=UPI001EF467B8|nr:FAD-dependent oxidoreductase [Frankia sp. CiP3]